MKLFAKLPEFTGRNQAWFHHLLVSCLKNWFALVRQPDAFHLCSPPPDRAMTFRSLLLSGFRRSKPSLLSLTWCNKDNVKTYRKSSFF